MQPAKRHPPVLLPLLLLFVHLADCQEKAEVDIRVSGACSPIYLHRKGIDVNKYRPAIRFNPDKIQLVPKNPVIPGCIKIKAEGVEILRPVKNLVAEVEMRIGGTPDPNNPTLPCSKKIDEKVNQCPCSKLEGTWSAARIFASRHLTGQHKSIDDDCKCDEMEPGLYDIETEMCTPELDDAKDYIPPEIQANILDKRPISMFITVYLMDLESRNESYLSAFGRAILQRRMAQSTVACFLLGIDVKLALPQFN
uniref:Secreted protein n=1 Tax=Heterorhabditis bacteriophora TaxID=37862 RepID=A0A1I7X5W8_HETBA